MRCRVQVRGIRPTITAETAGPSKSTMNWKQPFDVPYKDRSDKDLIGWGEGWTTALAIKCSRYLPSLRPAAGEEQDCRDHARAVPLDGDSIWKR
jgi:hypothetical protein